MKNLPNQMFELELLGGNKLRAHLSAEMKLKYVRLVPGERVEVEISPFDSGKGRIVAKAD